MNWPSQHGGIEAAVPDNIKRQAKGSDLRQRDEERLTVLLLQVLQALSRDT